MRRTAWCAGAIALAACGRGDGAGEPDAAPPSSVRLIVGSASLDRERFIAVEDGDDVPLVAGSQGGFHVWTGLRLQGAAGRLHVQREARRVADGELVLLAPTIVMEVPPDALRDWWERPDAGQKNPLASFMCPTPIGIRVRDEPLRLRVRLLSEEDDLLAEDDLVVVPRCPAEGEAQAEFCAEICSG